VANRAGRPGVAVALKSVWIAAEIRGDSPSCCH